MTKESLPPVTVVIPHRGSDSSLEKCVLAIRKQNYPRDLIKVVLVVNEAKTRKLDFNLKAGETLVFQHENFSYAARNQGISLAESEIIALTDSDTVPGEEWLSEGVKSVLAGADLVAGGIKLTFASKRPTAAGLYEQLFAFDQEKNVRLGQSVTANLFATKHAFEKYGTFDANARSGEDFEWTRAAVKAGAKLVVSPLALVSHPAREDLREMLRKTYRTTWFFPHAPKGQSTSSRVFRRAWGQLTLGPSPSKKQGMRFHQRLVAHLVRGTLILLKAVLMAGYFLKRLILNFLGK